MIAEWPLFHGKRDEAEACPACNPWLGRTRVMTTAPEPTQPQPFDPQPGQPQPQPQPAQPDDPGEGGRRRPDRPRQ